MDFSFFKNSEWNVKTGQYENIYQLLKYLMGMFLEGILKTTLRNFKKNIATTLIKTLGLVISIAAVITIWSFVINENKFDKNIPTSERVYRLETGWASMPPYLGHYINQNPTNQIIATRLNFRNDVGIQVDNNPYNLKDLAFADSTFFKVFPFKFIAGDQKEPLNRPFTLVLTESLAKRLFGSVDAVGKTIRFENQADFTITAIIKDQPFLHFKISAIASIITLEEIGYKGILKEYDGWSYPTYILFPEGIRSAESEKTVLDLLKKAGYNDSFRLRPFRDIYYLPEVENESNTKHGNILYNKILISVSIFILLLAAINFINLTISNAISRSKEVSLKKLQGASKLHLIMQFLFETVFFIMASVLLAFFILWFIKPLLYSLTGLSVNSTDFFTFKHLFVLVTGLVIFILISGIYPSFYISSFNINSNKTSHVNQVGIRNGLILFQNLVSITLICCTLLANQQFRFMNKKDLGFDKNNIVNLKINSQLSGKLDLFKEKLLSNPEITSISYSSRIPGNYWGSWCCVKIDGNENKYFNNYVDPDYLKTMGIRIKDGRNFSAGNASDIKATYLINETAITKYGLKNPIGQIITPGNGIKGEIIGIFKDFHYRGLNYGKTPVLLFYTADYLNYVNIRINDKNINGALEKIKIIWEEVCPAFSFEYTFLNETYDQQYKSERRFENLLFSFALLALFIATIGLLGLSIYSAERRTKEIGIRKVSGATVSEIIVMLNKDFLKWVVAAFIIACPISWYAMSKWLQNFVYRTDLPWWIFCLSGLIALGIAILTVSWQSWRAATRNPVEAIRYE
jgi:putative ABC transport system permease protein